LIERLSLASWSVRRTCVSPNDRGFSLIMLPMSLFERTIERLD